MTNAPEPRPGTGQRVLLVIAWLLVTVLLGYGLVQTLITASKLFGG